MGHKEVVSNTGPLIHLAKVTKLWLLRELFGKVIIPESVKREAIDQGKGKGARDAFLIEEGVRGGWIELHEGKACKSHVA